MIKATAYIDGSGNSARVQACATIIHVAEGQSHKRTRLLPPHTTNNVGEYNGLLLCLSLAAELGVDDLRIFSDSKLIVYQIRGKWKCEHPMLLPLRDRARELAQTFQKVSLDWIPRAKNKEADALCRAVIKAYELSPNNPFLRVRSEL